jgi:DNA polymerase-3 subunit delta
MAVHSITGDDDALIGLELGELVDRLVGDGDRSLMVDDFSGDDYELRAVVDAAQTLPFLTPTRVVIARGVGRFGADEVAPLVAYLEDPLPTTELVVVAGGGRVAKPLADALKRSGAAVISSAVPIAKRDRSTWIDDQLDRHGVRLDPGARAALATWLGDDAGRLAPLAMTLRSAFGADKRLSASDIEPFLGDAGGVPPWELTDAIDHGDTRLALDLLQRMMRSRHPLQLMATLQSHYGRLLRLDGSGVVGEAAAAELLGMKPGFKVRKLIDQGARLGSAGVAKAIGLLAGADLDLRGRRDLPEEVVMEVLVARLSKLAPATAARRR